ncbi:MAG TPA: carboxypeptidase regulatory-like domain-containing protein, partial [Solirubrobacteraceae bacterium]|nr:carboxypeptidase regulatory-like domain-containing protein [Solirubrobacteraceae bacterium]
MSARMAGFLLAALTLLLASAPLAGAASISGTVFRDGSSPLAGIQGVCVEAEGPSGVLKGTTTTAGGDYALTGLAAGTWSVEAKPCGTPYTDAGSASEGSRTVTADQSVTGLTLYLAAAPRSIAGRVTGQGGAALAGATVRLYNGPSGGSTVDSVRTAYDGRYTVVPNAADTDWRLEFSAPRHATEWHLDKPTRATGDDVAVSAGAPHMTGIDAALTFNQGTIAGTVTGAGGAALADVQVVASAISGGGGVTRHTYTNASGAYTMAVQTGTYTLRFQPKHSGDERPVTSGDYLEEHWNDTVAPGTTVTVSGGATFTASAQLARGARVAGRVLDEQGQPLVDYEVKAYVRDDDPAPDSPLPAAVTYTNASGEYAVRGIALGAATDRLYVRATPHCCDVPRTNELNPGAASAEFSLAPGQQLTGKDIVSPTLGRMTGQITRAGGQALGGQYEVLFLTPDGRVVVRNTAFGGPRDYQGPLLEPGQYRVRVQPDARTVFGFELWQNATRLADATPLTIVAGRETDADIELPALAAPRPANDDVAGAA